MVILLTTVAFAQSDAQKSFDKLKSLAGPWEGRLTTVPPTPEADGKLAKVSLRVTSMGNALMHEMKIEGRTDDPITMLYLDTERLMLTHYCDAGNRPRMIGKMTRRWQRRWNLNSSISPAARNTAICTMPCSP